jgi:MFS family permease
MSTGQPFALLRGRHFTLGLLFLLMALSVADRALINVALPSLKAEFSLSDSQLGLLAGLAFSAVHVVLALPVAMLADRTSRARVLTVSLALWSLATAVTAFCGSFIQLLLARTALGAAESGAASPAHSMIADIYPPEERPFALSIYSAGQGLGGFLGMAGGAAIIGFTGDWRSAFLFFGIGGIVLAVVFQLTLREPQRGLAEGRTASIAQPEKASLKEALKVCLSRPTFLHVWGCSALNSLASVGVTTWFVTFLVRTHGMSIAQAGIILAPILLISGTLSQIGGGWLSGKLGKRDLKYTLLAPAVIIVIGVPIEIAALLVEPTWLCLTLFFIGNLSVGPFAGASNSAVQGVAGVRQRTMAAALFLLAAGLIGAGFGPLINGMLSDGLKAAYGEDSLRIAMVIMLTIRLGAALHLALGSRHIAADFARRPD